jgi:hypothetical protein
MGSHMYEDSVKQWNVYVGCNYLCQYCQKSFRLQMKRQLHNCIKCYDYVPHFHPDRLTQQLPRTQGDEFIWACSSSDITFAKREWIEAILKRVRQLPDRTFLFQTKNPICFKRYSWTDNTVLDVTIETNEDEGYRLISTAPLPSIRYRDFLKIKHPHKFVTVEPILEFDMDVLVEWIGEINPERVYLGYDSKNCSLPEPELAKTQELKKRLEKFTKVKLKLMRKAWWRA